MTHAVAPSAGVVLPGRMRGLNARHTTNQCLRLVTMCACAVAASGCTSIDVDVRPVDPALGVRHVCIEENPKVLVVDFVPVVREGFARHGITTEVVTAPAPERCEYVLTYTALRSWALTPYLSQAEIRLTRAGSEVARAEYRVNGKSDFSLTKHQGTRAKMDAVIDELLRGYPSAA